MTTEPTQQERVTQGAVLFADLLMSNVYDDLGEQTGTELVAQALGVLKKHVAASSGRVSKTVGQEILALFPDVAEAMQTAVAMQKELSELGEKWPGGSRMRIGVAWSPSFIERDGEPYGDFVSVAYRGMSLGGKRKIALTGDAVGRLGPDQQRACRHLHTLELKGKGTKIEFFEYVWE